MVLAVSIGVAIATAACLLTIAVRRYTVERTLRRNARFDDAVRPVALNYLEGDQPLPVRGTLPRSEERALARVLRSYTSWLRGDQVGLIAGFFEGRGHYAAELRRLRSRRAWRRASAAHRLGRMGIPEATSGLMVALDDRDRDVRSAAVEALGRLDVTRAAGPIVRLLAANAVPRVRASKALMDIGPESIPALQELLKDDDPEVRSTALEILGFVGDMTIADLVASRLQDASAEVRAKACRALGRIGARSEAGALRLALTDRIPFVRVAAAHALGEIRDRSAMPILTDQARKDDFDPARAAAEALAKIDRYAAIGAASWDNAGPHLREAAGLAELEAA